MVLVMAVDRIPYPFRGRDGCNNGGGKGLTKKYFIDHLGSRHFSSDESKRYLKDHIASDPCLFSSLHIALKKAGIWFCGGCLRTHSSSKSCRHANGSMLLAPTSDADAIHGIPRPLASIGADSLSDEPTPLGSSIGLFSPSFDVDLLGRVFTKPFRTSKKQPSQTTSGLC